MPAQKVISRNDRHVGTSMNFGKNIPIVLRRANPNHQEVKKSSSSPENGGFFIVDLRLESGVTYRE